MLVDTDVLVWVLRGNVRAARAVERLPIVALSIVTYMELAQGTRSKEELRALRATLAEWSPRIVAIDGLEDRLGTRAQRLCRGPHVYLSKDTLREGTRKPPRTPPRRQGPPATHGSRAVSAPRRGA